MRTYRRARGVVDPSSFLVATGVEQAGSLGADRTPAHERLLRIAWLGGINALRAQPRNAQALHVLARVYLATGHPDSAIAVAKRAVVADPTGAQLCLWEADAREGAQVVNESNAWAISALQTADPEAAGAFYEAVFGWTPETWGPMTLFRPSVTRT